MPKHPLRFIAAAVFAFLGGAVPVQAVPSVQIDRVRLAIALETSARPGTTVWVALQQVIAPGWHTYWRNPGDSGLATSVSWTLPKGVTAGEPQWPTPKRILSGPIVDYGYQNEATILIRLIIAWNAVIGPSPARANVFLLECAQMCIPEQATLNLDLRTASGSPALFANARAALPRAFMGSASAAVDANSVTLTMTGDVLRGIKADALRFYPAMRRAVNEDLAPEMHVNGATLTWKAARPLRTKPFGTFAGVLDISGVGTFAISAPPVAHRIPAPLDTNDMTLAGAVLFAFLGGLILNLMPCVLPILSMKALALGQSGENAHELRRDGLFYFVGVQATFALVAGILLILKAGGAALGWGYQLQSPLIVFALALLMVAIGLNLLGLFEVPLRLAGVGDSLTRAKGGHGAFFTGALAVVVASPCTAPFMGTALGYALMQPSATSIAVFLALGTGFALPFSALAYTPALVRTVPRPGPWMVRFKEFLAFPMLATAIWLVCVLNQQVGTSGLAVALGIALGIVFLIWLFRILGPRSRWIVSMPGFAALFALSLDIHAATSPTESSWTPWSLEAVSAAREARRPVLVDFSAAWCVTCIVNERVALQNASVTARLRKYGVVTLKGDWTNRNAAISEELNRYRRSGVPLYLLYPPGTQTDVLVLPQILTPAVVLSALDHMETTPTIK